MDENLLVDDDNIRLTTTIAEQNKRASEVIKAGIKNLDEHFIQQCITELGISREEVEAIIATAVHEQERSSKIEKDSNEENIK